MLHWKLNSHKLNVGMFMKKLPSITVDDVLYGSVTLQALFRIAGIALGVRP